MNLNDYAAQVHQANEKWWTNIETEWVKADQS